MSNERKAFDRGVMQGFSMVRRLLWALEKQGKVTSLIDSKVRNLALSYINCEEGTGERLMPDLMADIRDFHVRFNQSYDGGPRTLDREEMEFRIEFQEEETTELAAGHMIGDKEKVLDAEVDIVYVALGTAYLHGHDFYEAWRRVHAANMKKEPAGEGEFKIKKPAGWVPPDLSDLV